MQSLNANFFPSEHPSSHAFGQLHYKYDFVEKLGLSLMKPYGSAVRKFNVSKQNSWEQKSLHLLTKVTKLVEKIGRAVLRVGYSFNPRYKIWKEFCKDYNECRVTVKADCGTGMISLHTALPTLVLANPKNTEGIKLISIQEAETFDDPFRTVTAKVKDHMCHEITEHMEHIVRIFQNLVYTIPSEEKTKELFDWVAWYEKRIADEAFFKGEANTQAKQALDAYFNEINKRWAIISDAINPLRHYADRLEKDPKRRG